MVSCFSLIAMEPALTLSKVKIILPFSLHVHESLVTGALFSLCIEVIIGSFQKNLISKRGLVKNLKIAQLLRMIHEHYHDIKTALLTSLKEAERGLVQLGKGLLQYSVYNVFIFPFIYNRHDCLSCLK